jgi:hypothetical protein
MKIAIARKPMDQLVPTPIVQQTPFWGRVHRRLGFDTDAFDVALSTSKVDGDFLVLRSQLTADTDYAYVPFGPEVPPAADDMGPFLERLSLELQPLLGPRCAFVRWDLPWEAVHARDGANFRESGEWLGPPATQLRELRMNMGTDEHNLWKAARDFLPPDTVMIDLLESEAVILSRMHPKTRYNVKLAERRGVMVTEGTVADLREWYAMYLETTARHSLEPMSFAHAEAMLQERADDDTAPVATKLLLARHGDRLLAGMLLALAPARATYLYGASTRAHRELMGSSALQWAAIRTAKSHGCREYDLLGAAPRPDTDHPLARVHRFKHGFGGRLLHREGCWDFPFDGELYRGWRSHEGAIIARRAAGRS